MCTVTFVPRKNGYALGMNRDEQLAREIARPPATIVSGASAMICPSEPGGGTWIAVNSGGVCLALINWYAIAARVSRRPVSRGEIVRTLGTAATEQSVSDGLERLPLSRINPFRLIGFFPGQNLICEWRWDLKVLRRQNHSWKMQQWISSGFDEPEAQRRRGQVFKQARRQKSAGGLDWLRRLHRSHRPKPGPFSTCMHRSEAATVSYAEVVVTPGRSVMRYQAGAPCAGGKIQALSLLKPKPQIAATD